MPALVPCSAVTHAASCGAWCDPASCDAGIPGASARVLVPAGVTVTVDCDTARLDNVRVDAPVIGQADPNRVSP